MSEGAVAPPFLVGDIGGTNVRFALVDRAGEIRQARVFACEDYASIEDAISTYLEEATAAFERPRAAALAVAGPVAGDRVSLTNHPWAFSTAALTARLGLARLRVVNDFTANALAVPHLTAGDLSPIGGGSAVAGAPIGVVGPGSGLGVGALVPVEGRWHALPGEGGHVTMAPASLRESTILDRMRRRFDHVSAERVLSGPGLVNIYNTLAEIEGVPAAPYAPAQIADPQTCASDALCREAREMFCAMLGTIAGNLALTLGARGGIYIAGGIIPRFGPIFAASGFRRRFEEKGRFSAYLAAIPTFVITHPHPAFLGLAHLLREMPARD